MAEQIWLHYFNQYLFKHQVITEEQRNKMAVKIEERYSRTKE